MIYTPWHGKRNPVDTYSTILSNRLILIQSILMKVLHRGQILSLSRAPIFMIQAMAKIGKLAPLLTRLLCIFQISNRMIKVETLRPTQTYIKMIIPNKQSSHARTLKLDMNLWNNHNRGRVTFVQRLKSTILLPNLFHKMNLIVPEAANTTYALTLALITQKYTDIDLWKILFQPFLCGILIL